MPSGLNDWNWLNKFVAALRQSKNCVLAVPCGATVLGLHLRNALGSKSRSNHSNVAFHLGVLSVSQKPFSDRGLIPIECNGGFGCDVEDVPNKMRSLTMSCDKYGAAWR